MNTSDWNDKLLKQKLNELPLNIEADAAWTDMKELLDLQLPVNSPIKPSLTTTSLPLKVVTILSYIAGAVLIIAAIMYLANDKPDKTPVKPNPKDSIITFTKPALAIPDTPNKEITQSLEQNTLQSAVNNSEQAKQTSNTNALIKVSVKEQTSVTDQTITALEDVLTKPMVLQEPAKQTLETGLLSELYARQDIIGKIRPPSITTTTEPAPSRSTDLNTETAQNNKGSKLKKDKKVKPKKEKSTKEKSVHTFSYGLSAGINARKNATVYLGAFAELKITKQVSLNAALLYNTARTLTGSYTRPSYTQPDSLPNFSFTDSRKLTAVDLPLTVSYKLNEGLSLNAGPVISIPISRSKTSLGKIVKPSDTLRNGKQLITELENTTVNKINFGLKTGLSLQLKKLSLDVNYQWLSPYQLKNSIGNNKLYYNTLQIGISYRIK